MIWAAVALVFLSLAISIPATAWLIRAGHRAGMLDSQGAAGHEKALRTVPNIGGIAITAAIVLPYAIGLAVLGLFDETWLAASVPGLDEQLLQRVRETMPTAAALLACIIVLHITGVVDDRRPLKPWPKFLIQLLVATVMVVVFDVRLLTALGYVPSILLTILWIIAITNAINFMDNMDGLAGGVVLIAATLFLIATLINAQWFIAGLLALMIGATGGFLLFNFPPARIFMGDGGSMVLGFLLAVLTVRTTYYDAADPDFALGTAWYGLFMPIVVLAIPIYDLISVTLIRLRQKRSPLVGDQQHFSHRLVQRGLSKRSAVLLIWGATAVTGIGGISLGQLRPWQAALVGIQTLLVLAAIAMFEHASRHATNPRADQRSASGT